MSPAWVNFSELLRKFIKIWRSLTGSNNSFWATLLSRYRCSDRLFFNACRFRVCIISDRNTRISIARFSSETWPASSLEKSRISSITWVKCCAELCTVTSILFCSSSSRVLSSSSSQPRMPCTGVRISWLMVARKVAFARAAASALVFASSSMRSWRRD
ncbi:hypothetical protein D3C80_968490 [compost metagenome]